ncbi:acylphosphatase [Desulfonatronospira thiodismutans ASO3-1]|uniref:Acylphosphatase n=1 Tax=Desulfonatronospira thiodismutans ASO3-1 TaxID=555779 RepID=D6SQQ2_9BACT|nr:MULTISPECIES: acylphosphatase [Desulfonatronospira]EFI35078.1 acylphosphatase [Desulfonatronospira thiodismutans ASO3-1]RQD78327.1 MAG: acylphosphatase [Desulfonatronospira sp. MSAO_Bac3]
MNSMHCILSGKVQGVFFRSWTQEQAQSLGVKGWVRNLHDGRVEVLAQGDENALAEFKKRLIQGSSMSEVKDIKCEDMEYDKTYSKFEIR